LEFQLVLRHEARAWIAAQTEWKWLGGTPLNHVIANNSEVENSNEHEHADVLADFSLEITFTRRVITTRGPVDADMAANLPAR
jgi:hypothetical protein